MKDTRFEFWSSRRNRWAMASRNTGRDLVWVCPELSAYLFNGPGNLDVRFGLWHPLRLRESLGRLSGTCGVQKSALIRVGVASGAQAVHGVTVAREDKLGLRVTCSGLVQLLREVVMSCCVLWAQKASTSYKCPSGVAWL